MRGWLAAQGRRFANTVVWSLQGWRAAWSSEVSLRQWVGVNAASAALAFALDLTAGERALLLALGLLVLAAELLNTAVEVIVDHILPDPHPAAQKAKDCGSAAVALTALAGGVAWAVILGR
jgi:diacylglycerol kinase (ATP)